MTHEGLKRCYVVLVSDLTAKTCVKIYYVRLLIIIITM